MGDSITIIVRDEADVLRMMRIADRLRIDRGAVQVTMRPGDVSLDEFLERLKGGE